MAYLKPTDRNKPWARRKMPKTRELKSLSKRNTFIIYCEGEVTEPTYFKSFPINTETIVEAIGLGRSKTALVRKALELLTKEKRLKRQKNYDSDTQIWMVFDYDIRPNVDDSNDYNQAIQLAQAHNINVAYSNDCFELWFLLHYQFQNTNLTRFEYYNMLSNKLNCNYEKEGKSLEYSKSLYHIFLPLQPKALQLAHRLYEHQKHLPFNEQNPCTTVFKLVEELNKCLKQ
ncbi:RloB domain-containing protein [Puteibacter caeruleilacunae]|nr:RloB domain-containing protein [Puteibacter caeruleilacunae]